MIFECFYDLNSPIPVSIHFLLISKAVLYDPSGIPSMKYIPMVRHILDILCSSTRLSSSSKATREIYPTAISTRSDFAICSLKQSILFVDPLMFQEEGCLNITVSLAHSFVFAGFRSFSISIISEISQLSALQTFY